MKIAIILVGEDPASLSYIKQKMKACEATGLICEQINYTTDVTQEELITKLENLSTDMGVHGILVQLPLPKHIDTSLVLKYVDPRKDIDGFHAYNLGKMFLSREFEGLVPCTPKGIIRLLEHYKVKIKGKDVTIVGHSNLVGKPLSVMLLNRDATITTCHVHTKDLKSHTKNADILISATGVPNLIKASLVKKGAVVVDVGCVKVKGKLQGDVDFEKVKKVARAITPVPGGIGPMTVACLIENTVIAYRWLKQHNFKP